MKNILILVIAFYSIKGVNAQTIQFETSIASKHDFRLEMLNSDRYVFVGIQWLDAEKKKHGDHFVSYSILDIKEKKIMEVFFPVKDIQRKLSDKLIMKNTPPQMQLIFFDGKRMGLRTYQLKVYNYNAEPKCAPDSQEEADYFVIWDVEKQDVTQMVLLNKFNATTLAPWFIGFDKTGTNLFYSIQKMDKNCTKEPEVKLVRLNTITGKMDWEYIVKLKKEHQNYPMPNFKLNSDATWLAGAQYTEVPSKATPLQMYMIDIVSKKTITSPIIDLHHQNSTAPSWVFNPDGESVVWGTWDSLVKINLRDGSQTSLSPGKTPYQKFVNSPSGKYLFIFSDDNGITLKNIEVRTWPDLKILKYIPVLSFLHDLKGDFPNGEDVLWTHDSNFMLMRFFNELGLPDKHNRGMTIYKIID